MIFGVQFALVDGSHAGGGVNGQPFTPHEPGAVVGSGLLILGCGIIGIGLHSSSVQHGGIAGVGREKLHSSSVHPPTGGGGANAAAKTNTSITRVKILVFMEFSFLCLITDFGISLDFDRLRTRRRRVHKPDRDRLSGDGACQLAGVCAQTRL